jgi:hypothetical protein
MNKTLPVQQTTKKLKKKKALIEMLHTIRMFSQYLQEHTTYNNMRTKYYLIYLVIKQHIQSIIPITHKFTAFVCLKNTSYKNSSQFFVIQTLIEAMCAEANAPETRRDVSATSSLCSSKHSNLNTFYK